MAADCNRSSKTDQAPAFTLVEILILLVIIGILATVAMPYMRQALESSQNVRLVNDWATFMSTFEIHVTETGEFPPDGAVGEIPTGMEEFLGETAWTAISVVGGSWSWDLEQYGFAAGISLADSKVPAWQMRDVDDQMDDGDLANGLFRQTGPFRFTYILQL